MEKTEVTKEIRSEIKQHIFLAEQGCCFGDGFECVPFFGKFKIKYDESEKEFDFILDALKLYNSITSDKSFWDCSRLPELICFNEKTPTN